MNCSPGEADVIHYTVDKFRNVVYPDLASCLIVLKPNAVQLALHAAFCYIEKRMLHRLAL